MSWRREPRRPVPALCLRRSALRDELPYLGLNFAAADRLAQSVRAVACRRRVGDEESRHALNFSFLAAALAAASARRTGCEAGPCLAT